MPKPTMKAQTPAMPAELAALRARIATLEAELEIAEQRYDNLFEGVGDSVFIVDFDSFRIVTANDHAARRLGYTHAELLQLSMDEIEVADADEAADQKAWESTVSGTMVYECHYRHKTGRLLPVEVSSRTVHIGGKTVMQNFVRDITARRQFEQERTDLIKDLDSYANTVAHDIKNPLFAVVSFANLIQELGPQLPKEEQDTYLGYIASNGQRALHIVDELLLFAQIRNQRDVPAMPIPMSSVVSDVLARLDQQINATDAKIAYPASWPIALGYAPWLQEVWANYLSNALKYGGSPPHIELGYDPPHNDMVRFWVRDQGPGIATDAQPALFDEFSRMSDMRVDGHGLGLSIVKRIVAKLGGTVDVVSAEGQGSTFGFTLPQAP